MLYDIVLYVYFFFWYLLVTVAVIFCISGLDDLFFDFFYWFRFFYRLWKTRKYAPFTYKQLSSIPEKRIAVLIPCWHEENVIGTMLAHNSLSIDYHHYDLFVGVYPNDPETIEAVQNAEKKLEHVCCVIGEKPGPTNKAANLNEMYRFILQSEKQKNIKYSIIVFHDSEDIIHPLSLKLYNYLIPRKDMIQTPVFPLEVGYFKFTHWVYNDEFCEIHTKDIIVRESIKAMVPSAGVGTAFSRTAIESLAKDNNGSPFTVTSLTEDYRTALLLRLKNFKEVFVLQFIKRKKWRKRWFLFGKYIKVKYKEPIATRALFPFEYSKAVRQKARWIMGISFQEWSQSGWVGNLSTRYVLFHDRKAVFTHLINIMGYGLFWFWLAYYFLTKDSPYYPSLQEQLDLAPWVWYLVLLSSFLMIERFIQRIVAIYRIYGVIPALLTLPRVFYGNFINLHALLRAYRLYFTTPKQERKSAVWEKTEHHFPGSHILIPYKKRLGDVLVENKFSSKFEIEKALDEHRQTGEFIGTILIQNKIISSSQLSYALSVQYALPLASKSALKILRWREMKGISWYNYHWLMYYGVYPVKYSREQRQVIIAIADPSNEKKIQQISKHLKPNQVDFILYDASN